MANKQEKKKDEKRKPIRKVVVKRSPKGKKRETKSYRFSLHHLCVVAAEIKALIQNEELHMKAIVSCPLWRFFELFYDSILEEDELIHYDGFMFT
ncbi:hypothetical protein C5167_004371 [Papaver somniferum]|uniref:Uncharacterized protein n=1 Tax=Papaver somniferum TaxID=3469 RepID=A0A4Y7JAM6_PAPSO|nr:hypothetical protein C5167_004371 [Papaver somniferum]